MVTKSTFRQIRRTLKLIRRARKLENGLCAQFGPTSEIAVQANSTTGEALALFMTLMDGFKDGLHLSPGQTYDLSLMMPLAVGKDDAEALKVYLSELTDGFCTGVVLKQSDGCTLSFNRAMSE